MDAKLSVIPVSPTEDSNSFDESQVIVVKVKGSPHAKGSRFELVGEPERLPVWRKLPPRGFVFHRARFFKAGISFLPRNLSLAILVEAFDGAPGSFDAGLSGLRIEFSRPVKFFGENFALG